jgi:hypothetical protein
MRSGLLLLPAFALLFWLGGDGFNAYFTGDDGMNLNLLHGYWTKPFWRILSANLLFFIPEYRPLGGLFYRSMFAAFGYDPFAFRVACFVLLAVNLVLAFLLARRLSGSAAAGALAAFITAYHPTFQDLYYSTGTVYDLLCFTFYSTSLLYYTRTRAHGDLPWRRLAVLALLNVLALNAKEMALTLPAALAAYEWLYFSRSDRKWRGVVTSAVITLIFAAGKMLTTNVVTVNDAYRPVLTLGRLMETTGHYYDSLLSRNPRLLSAEPLLFVLIIAFAAWRVRQVPFRWGLMFAGLTMIPLLFIPGRAGFALYIPYFGWALAGATLALRLGRRFHPAVSFAVVAAVIVPWYVYNRSWMQPPIKRLNENARSAVEQLKAAHPQLPLGAVLLLRNDPFPPNDWGLLFLARLRYDDPNLWIDREGRMKSNPVKTDLSVYDHILSFEDGKVRNVLGTDLAAGTPPVAVRFSPERVRRGEKYVVEIPDFAKQTIDVTYLMSTPNGPVDGGIVRKWCQLDGNGAATIVTPPDHPPATVRITRIRSDNGEWLRARGAITVMQ